MSREHKTRHVDVCERCGLMRVTNETRLASLCQDCRYMDRPVAQQRWHNDASCRSHPDKELWQTTALSSGRRREDIEIAQDRVEIAKAICAGCPVSAECLEASRNEPTGIWGGLDVTERARHFGKSSSSTFIASNGNSASSDALQASVRRTSAT